MTGQPPPPPPPTRESGAPLVRPRDAATLIVYRRRRGRIEVLVGERHQRHRFLPQRYVFPGGRVDPEDARVRIAAPLRADVACQLARRIAPARGRAAAAAALRETFEETGLIVGAPDPAPGAAVPGSWRGFFAGGLAPAVDRLVYVARALTPPSRPIRFDARFFMVDSVHVTGTLEGSGELLDLHYVPIDEARRLELPMITAKVLAEIADLLAYPPSADADRPIPFFKHVGPTHLRILE